MQNITISAWNSSNIVFTPQNCNGTGWAVSAKDGGSGRYRRCTSTRTPSARLSFTGSAVYYASTYFENQTIQFCLDGVCSAGVQLSPPQGISANSSVSKVMWYREDLREGERTLELFPANNGSTLVVDTFLYTTNETPASSSIESSSSSSPQPQPPLPSSASPSPPSSPSAHTARAVLDNQTIGLIIGTIAGSLSGLVLLGLLVIMCRRKRGLNAMRRYHTFSAQTFRSRLDNSVHQDTQQSRLTALSYDEPHFSKSPDPIPALPVPQRAGSSATRHKNQSSYSYLDMDSREDIRSKSEWTNPHTVNNHSSSYRPNYPKLEPLRKAT